MQIRSFTPVREIGLPALTNLMTSAPCAIIFCSAAARLKLLKWKMCHWRPLQHLSSRRERISALGARFRQTRAIIAATRILLYIFFAFWHFHETLWIICLILQNHHNLLTKLTDKASEKRNYTFLPKLSLRIALIRGYFLFN